MTHKPSKRSCSKHRLQHTGDTTFHPTLRHKRAFGGNVERKESLRIAQVRLPDRPPGSLTANPSTWHNKNTSNLLETDWTFLLSRTTVVPLSFTLPYHVWTSLNHIALGWNHRPGSKILYQKHVGQYGTSPECNKTFSIITEHRSQSHVSKAASFHHQVETRVE